MFASKANAQRAFMEIINQQLNKDLQNFFFRKHFTSKAQRAFGELLV